MTDHVRMSVPSVRTRVQARNKNAIFLNAPCHRQKRVRATGKSGTHAMQSVALEHVLVSDPVSAALQVVPVAKMTMPRLKSARVTPL